LWYTYFIQYLLQGGWMKKDEIIKTKRNTLTYSGKLWVVWGLIFLTTFVLCVLFSFYSAKIVNQRLRDVDSHISSITRRIDYVMSSRSYALKDFPEVISDEMLSDSFFRFSNWIVEDSDGQYLLSSFGNQKMNPGRVLESIEKALAHVKDSKKDSLPESTKILKNSLSNGWAVICLISSNSLFALEIYMMRGVLLLIIILLVSTLIVGLQASRHFKTEMTSLSKRIEEINESDMNELTTTADDHLIVDEIPVLQSTTAEKEIGIQENPVDNHNDKLLSNTYEIEALSNAFNETFNKLTLRNLKLQNDIEKNQHLAAEMSRFYSHVRVMNESNLRMDFFEYDMQLESFTFITGLVTILGPGSQIYREMQGRDFFSNYQISVRFEEFMALCRNLDQTNESFTMEFKAIAPFGEVKWIRCWGKTVDKMVKISGVLTDITQDVEQRLANKEQSYRDNITGFYNRNALSDMAGKILDSKQPDELIVFAYLSLGQYKNFESRFGMLASSRLISSCGDTIKKHIFGQAVIFRWFTSDFLIVFRGITSMEDFLISLDGMLQNMERTRGVIDGVAMNFSMDVGYSVCGLHGTTPSELLEYASFAKHEINIGVGRSPNQFNRKNYDESRRVAVRRSFVNDVIERNELAIVFQPIVSFKTAEVYGFEALSRPTSLIYQSVIELIDDAENSGCYPALEKRMIYNSLDSFLNRPTRFHDAYLFINTSPFGSLTEADYLDFHDRYFDFMKVVFEVIERKHMEPGEIELRKNMVTTIGAKFALDDFGSGYSNHIALLALEPDIIKIDCELIQRIDKDKRKQQLLEDIVNFAHLSGTSIIAEGIETREELLTVCKLGVDYGQGNFLAKPSNQYATASEESVELILNIVNVNKIELGQVVLVIKHALELMDPKFSASVVSSTCMGMLLADKMGMARPLANEFALGMFTHHLGHLLNRNGPWIKENDVTGTENALTIYGYMKEYLPWLSFHQAFLRHHEAANFIDGRTSDSLYSLESQMIMEIDNLCDEMSENPNKNWSQVTLGDFREKNAQNQSAEAHDSDEQNAVELNSEEKRNPNEQNSVAMQKIRKALTELLHSGTADMLGLSVWDACVERLNVLGEDDRLADGVLRVFMNLVSARSRYTVSHAALVEKITEKVCYRLELGWGVSERIRYASLCRGVGHISTPKSLFDKHLCLDREESEIVHRYVERTVLILSDSGLYDLMDLNARTANNPPTEQYNMTEKDFFIGRNIIAVADVLAALVEDRCYRSMMSKEEITVTLTEMADTGLLNVHTVDMFLNDLDEILRNAEKEKKASQRRLKQIATYVDEGRSLL
jgi:EAL domain-containing protein (putative c-di-GMP-specific phosphodiesterase class I)/HD-GYP domain-containing protein (c-di-GMP phosphodiesterase class II)/GGDEF domain-containing protein